MVWCNQIHSRGTQTALTGYARAEWGGNVCADNSVYVLGGAAFENDGNALIYFDNENIPLQQFQNEPTDITFFVRYNASTGEYMSQGIVPARNAYPSKTPAVLNNRVFAVSRANANTEQWLSMWRNDGMFILADTFHSTAAVDLYRSYGVNVNEQGYILTSLLAKSPVTFDNNVSTNCSWIQSNAVFALYHNPEFAHPFVADDSVDVDTYYQNREQDIYVYPNPTEGKTVVCGYMYDYRNIEIFDLQGRKVGESDWVELDLSAYPAGTYIIRINFNRNVSVTRKVVKE